MKDEMNFPKQCEGFVIEQLDGEVVLLHPVRNILIHSNQTGALIWQLCDGTRTVEEISDILSAAYPEAGARIAQDVPDTIRKLRAQGALDGG